MLFRDVVSCCNLSLSLSLSLRPLSLIQNSIVYRKQLVYLCTRCYCSIFPKEFSGNKNSNLCSSSLSLSLSHTHTHTHTERERERERERRYTTKNSLFSLSNFPSEQFCLPLKPSSGEVKAFYISRL